ncbi:MAG TPA: KpsF/GutQ family sugar-phosphate isomerase [Planctomycetaceae bacterium]|nr:KpsF/GutQ family sugar-phosphate isomerase [Planctomycetaceae bacterium]HQZ64907.1 KpsF/GutQ family sugar-phosphate isomerase [Planctomycetaceae bacterium]
MSAAQPARAVIAFGDVEQLREARRIIRQEADALTRLADSLDPTFCDAVRAIRAATGCVIVTGVGKAGLIGQKIVATLASTGTRSHFMHPTEARHGDLGCIGPEDVVLVLSNSGESEELITLIPSLKMLRVPVIAVTRDSDNSLARLADVVVRVGKHQEAGELGLAPSCSTTSMLAIGDALALVISQSKGFTARDFATFHPAGSLGRQLCPVKDVMRSGKQLRVALEDETVREVMVFHSHPGRRTGAVILTNATGRLTGLFTDSDLARMFENRRDEQLDQPIRDVMTRNPITLGPDVLLPEAIHLMSDRKLSEVPVIDADRIPVGMLDITDVLQKVDFAEQTASEKTPIVRPRVMSKSA